MRLFQIFSRKNITESPTITPPGSNAHSPESTPLMQPKIMDVISDSALSPQSPPPTFSLNDDKYEDIIASPIKPLSTMARPMSQASLILSSKQESLDQQNFIFSIAKNEDIILPSIADWRDHIKSGIIQAKSAGIQMEDMRNFAETLWEETEKGETEPVLKLYSSEPTSHHTTISIPIQHFNKYPAEEWYAKGKSKACRDEHTLAITYYNNALLQEVNPLNQEVKAKYYGKIALSYFFLGNIPKAELYCKNSLEVDEKYPQTYNTLSAICRYQSRQNAHQPEVAKAYLNQAKQYLKLSEKNSNPSGASGYLIEETLISMEKGDMKAANKCLNKVKKELLKQRDFSASTEYLDQVDQDHQAKISLIDDITSYNKERGSIKKKAIKQKSLLSPEATLLPEDIDIMNVIEKLKLSPERDLIKALAEEISQLKSNLGKLEDKSKSYVTADQVSSAIEKNPKEMLEEAQMQEINKNLGLKEYFEAFVSTIESAYLSAKIIDEGNVAIHINTPAMDLAAHLLSLIPVYGNTIGEVAVGAFEFYHNTEIKNAGTYLLMIAYNVDNLNHKVLPAARTAALQPAKYDQIMSSPTLQTNKWFLTMLTKISTIYHDMMNTLYVERHDTEAKRLGHKDACTVITQWIELQKQAKKTSPSPAVMNDEDIIFFIQRILIDSTHGDSTPSTPASPYGGHLPGYEPHTLSPIQEEVQSPQVELTAQDAYYASVV